METKFENSNSFRNLNIKGGFFQRKRENGDINSKLRGEGKVWERGWGVKGLGNTTLIIIAECW